MPVLLLVPAIALALPFLSAGLRLDDYVLLAILSEREPLHRLYPSRLDLFNFFDGTPERTRRMLDLGLLPWWTFPEVRVAFWRPLAAGTHWIDFAAWPNRPVLMHAHSLAWFGALVVTVGLMYRRLMGPTWVAGLATLLYVIDDGHALGMGWVAGRNSLIAATFGAATLIAHDRWRRGGSRAGAIVAPLGLAMSLLASEGSVAVVGYIAAHALCLERGGWMRRVAAVAPAATVVLAWQLVYSGLGYGVLGAAPYLDPVREPLLFVRALVANAPVMLLAQWGGPAVESFGLDLGATTLLWWSGAMLALAGLGLVLVPLLRRDPVARFWALGQVFALLPTGAAPPNDRYLFFVGFGAMGLIARFLAGWVDGAAWRPSTRVWRVLAAGVAGLLLLLHGLLAPIGLVRALTVVRGLGAAVERASDTMPVDPEIRHQLLVIPTAPTSGFIAYSFFFRTVKRQPIAAQTLLLAAGAPVDLYRPDMQTIVVRLLGPAERMFRVRENPMAPGAQLDLPRANVQVKATDEGLPRETIFRFDADLDSKDLRWIRWSWNSAPGGGYVPFRPPGVGERVRVD